MFSSMSLELLPNDFETEYGDEGLNEFKLKILFLFEPITLIRGNIIKF